jgi:hypothetical protein
MRILINVPIAICPEKGCPRYSRVAHIARDRQMSRFAVAICLSRMVRLRICQDPFLRPKRAHLGDHLRTCRETLIA